ncbi:hypothetical protein J7J26_02500 [Candidatus Micrarchaeota archaeon]|nr:hypothetical protein [Candidatus Micrarchaeota archaeon]
MQFDFFGLFWAWDWLGLFGLIYLVCWVWFLFGLFFVGLVCSFLGLGWDWMDWVGLVCSFCLGWFSGLIGLFFLFDWLVGDWFIFWD